jgi:hypothetical protein
MDFAIVDGIQYRHRDGEFNYVVKRELIGSVQRRALLAIGNTNANSAASPGREDLDFGIQTDRVQGCG